MSSLFGYTPAIVAATPIRTLSVGNTGFTASRNAAWLTDVFAGTNVGGDNGALVTLTAGDKVVLKAGATFAGTINLPVVSGVSAATPCWLEGENYATLMTTGTRVTTSQQASMPLITAPATSSGLGAIHTDTGASYWHLHGLAMAALSSNFSTNNTSGVLWIRSETTTALAHMPHHITVRHCLIRGQSSYGAGNGIRIYANHVAIYDCVIDRIWAANELGVDGGLYEGQGIEMVGGKHFTVDNVSISGGCEGIFFGAITQWSPDYIPNDIRITRCYLTKPSWMYYLGSTFGTASSEASQAEGWNDSGSDLEIISTSGPDGSGYYTSRCRSASHTFTSADVGKIVAVTAGGSWVRSAGRIVSVTSGDANIKNYSWAIGTGTPTGGVWRMDREWHSKNLFEIKQARNVLIEGCIFDTLYQQHQRYAVTFTNVNQSGSASIATSSIENVIVRNCIQVRTPAAGNCQGFYYGPCEKAQGLTYDNCLFADIDYAEYTLLLGGVATFELSVYEDVHFNHCTVWCDSASATPQSVVLGINTFRTDGFSLYGTNGTSPGLQVTNSIWYSAGASAAALGPSRGDWAATHTPESIWAGALCDGDYGGTPRWTVENNCFAGGTLDATSPYADNAWPNGAGMDNLNTAVATVEASHFESVATGDYRLKAGSALLTASQTGGPIGCDLVALAAAVSPDDAAWMQAEFAGWV